MKLENMTEIEMNINSFFSGANVFELLNFISNILVNDYIVNVDNFGNNISPFLCSYYQT